MRGIGQSLSLGERIAWYRRRRGMSQEVLAGMVGRTVDWLSKIENNRIDLDRLTVIRTVAEALDVTVGDLLGEPSLLDWSADSGKRTLPTLRDTLLDYSQILPFIASAAVAPPQISDLETEVGQVWTAYQESRYGYVTARLPILIRRAQAAVTTLDDEAQLRAFALQGLAYQVAAVLLTKLGETDLAWIAAERGLQAAQRNGDPVVVGSLLRSVTHALLSTGRYAQAKQFTVQAGDHLQPGLGNPTPQYLSVYGTLFLTGAMAAAYDGDRATVRAFLTEAEESARRVGQDANHLWTAFGPTNVAIHRVATAMELGDVQVAIDLGDRLNTAALPAERRARHAMEVSRALTARNRVDHAMAVLLDAEQQAPEQVRHHVISRLLVQSWIRRGRGKPNFQLADLARRVHAVD